MKSGSGSAVAFGRVLQAVRKRLSKSQADVAASFDPKQSVAAVSMAETGNRPPKTEATVRGYAAALELDEDALVELWWAMQGMVAQDSQAEERVVAQWWRELPRSPEAETEHVYAENAAKKARDPNNDVYPPSLQLFALAAAICKILESLLDDSWTVRYKRELGLYDPIDGRQAAVIIELRAGDSEGGGSNESELMTTFACPEPVARPVAADPAVRPYTGAFRADVAWINDAVAAMPARERAAVAAFIHGLREGASLYAEEPPPSR